MNFVTYTCEKCLEPFERATKPGGYRFCGQKCANQHALKLSREELLPYAELGALNKYMARRLEVSPCTIRRALIQHGLYRLWASRRYQKCASQTDGSTSAITACETVTIPSARLEPPTASDMSCGS